MVLSNKKLKQKLRSLLTESLVTAEAGEAAPRKDAGKEGEVSRQLESIKDILSSKRIQRPRPPRRKKQPCSEDPTSTAGEKGEGTGDEEKESGGLDSGDRKEKKKRKRKREGAEVDGSAVKEDSKKKSKSKKNTKKAKKKKDKTKKVENVNKEEGNDGTGKESVDGCANVKEAEAVVPPNVEVREESGEVAKKVYVGGIPYYSTEDDIRSFFEGCGTITEVDCMRFPESGKFRGIAILTFKGRDLLPRMGSRRAGRVHGVMEEASISTCELRSATQDGQFLCLSKEI